MNKPLHGDKNQCAGCREYFRSTSAFDKHRAGAFGIDRHCMTRPEMEAKGMYLADDGFWRGSRMPSDVLAKVAI